MARFCITRNNRRGIYNSLQSTHAHGDMIILRIIVQSNNTQINNQMYTLPFLTQTINQSHLTNGFRWWLVQWFEATEIAYYRATDFPHTLRLGGICSCILGGWFCSRYGQFLHRLGVEDMDVGAPPECLAHDREPNRVEIFKIGRCKELPDDNEQWVDDESRSRYERMIQLSTPSLDS
ncbi:hypothetical protein Taro_038406 [Colocasia esculenta]|uniref:Uncharacterized protein n=1 Tax=Colocasia esculenta TaxID=4460 RepID=A0A843WCQ6_COLES|nr:hypothetical protein [Colocasia esculenta]